MFVYTTWHITADRTVSPTFRVTPVVTNAWDGSLYTNVWEPLENYVATSQLHTYLVFVWVFGPVCVYVVFSFLANNGTQEVPLLRSQEPVRERKLPLRMVQSEPLIRYLCCSCRASTQPAPLANGFLSRVYGAGDWSLGLLYLGKHCLNWATSPARSCSITLQ